MKLYRNIIENKDKIDTILDKINELQGLVHNIKKEGKNNFLSYFLVSESAMEGLFNEGNRILIEQLNQKLKQEVPSQLSYVDTYLKQMIYYDVFAAKTLDRIIQDVDKMIQSCHLLSIFIELKKEEATEKYTESIHYQLTSTILEAIENNKEKKDMFLLIMKEVDHFLEQLSLQQKGNLVVEHFISDYDRNQTLFLKFLEQAKKGNNKNEESVSFYAFLFAQVLCSLAQRVKDPINQNKLLEAIQETEFYQKVYKQKEIQFRKK